jgi:hypothetical protein
MQATEKGCFYKTIINYMYKFLGKCRVVDNQSRIDNQITCRASQQAWHRALSWRWCSSYAQQLA